MSNNNNKKYFGTASFGSLKHFDNLFFALYLHNTN